MEQLICHLIGDYFLQNHWMALNKTKSNLACSIHVFFYTLPFLLLTNSFLPLLIISLTHYIIDRYSLGKKWPALYGIGCEGYIISYIRHYRRESFLYEWLGDRPARLDTAEQAYKVFDIGNPPIEPTPPFLAVWLTIIVDNTLHLAINFLVLKYA